MLECRRCHVHFVFFCQGEEGPQGPVGDPGERGQKGEQVNDPDYNKQKTEI